MLAGHEESGGKLVERDGKKYKVFYGMSSQAAMEKHTGGLADYKAAEGKCVEVPYKGSVQSTIQDILGGLWKLFSEFLYFLFKSLKYLGLRSSCTYVGAAKLKELSKRTTFVRVSQQSNEVFGSNKNI